MPFVMRTNSGEGDNRKIEKLYFYKILHICYPTKFDRDTITENP